MQIPKILDKLPFLKFKLDELWSSTSMTPSPKNSFKMAEDLGSVLFLMISLSSYSKKKFKVLLILVCFPNLVLVLVLRLRLERQKSKKLLI